MLLKRLPRRKYLWRQLALVVLIFTNYQIRGQKPQILLDSLQAELYQIPLPDSTGKSDSIIRSLCEVSERNEGTYDSLVAEIILSHYLNSYENMTPVEALPLLRQMEQIYKSMGSLDPLTRAKFHQQFVIEFRSISQNDSLVRHLDLMEKNLNQINTPSQLKITLEYEKARHAYLQNDFQGSLTYLQYALQYLDDHFPGEVLLRLNLLNGIGIGLRRTNQSKTAIDHHHKTLKYLDQHAEYAFYIGNIQNNLGLCHADLDHHQQAIFYMQEAIRSYQNLGARYTDQIASGYVNIGGIYSELGKIDSAVLFHQRSLNLMRDTYGPDYPDLLLPMVGLVYIYNSAGDYGKADSVGEQGLSLLKKLGWSPSDPTGDYFMDDAFDLLSYCISAKSGLYHETKDQQHLIEAIEISDAFMSTVDFAIDGLKNSISKEIFQERRGSTFSTGIDNLYTLYEITKEDSIIDKALQYMEKFKSLELLYAAIKDRINDHEIYRNLNQQHQILSDSILHFERSLVLATDSSTHFQDQLQNSLVASRRALITWRNKMQVEYPVYHQILFHPEDIVITDIQDDFLPQDLSLLTYHVGQNYIYGICINKDNMTFGRVPTGGDIGSKIEVLRNSVYEYFVTQGNSEADYKEMVDIYAKEAHSLYNILIQPFEQVLRHRVTILPDKSLSYLPFDLLLTTLPEKEHFFKNHSYLVNQHALSYCYSLHFWLEIFHKKKSANQEVLAFAPAFKEIHGAEESLLAMRAGLAPLNYNQEEVTNISKSVPSTTYRGTEATKSKFLQEVGRFGLIHLATHSKANDAAGDFSYLAFSNVKEEDFKLFANEIYSLQLNADLVTLSACESGIGELRYGEGMISLARAFIFAGAKSILSTLWAVNDKSTGELMTGYYENLAEDMPKDIALQKAKINYLSNHDHLSSHPFFWSGFITIGDVNPIEMAHRPRIWTGVCIMATIFFLWLFLRTRRVTHK